MIPSYLKILFLSFFLIGIFSCTIFASAQDSSEIKSYVTDNSYVFDLTTKQELEQALSELEQKTTAVQLVVFTEPRIPAGMTLEERSLQLAEQNKVGQEGKDNGILFYIATEDRQFRWEVGYGIEGTISSANLGRISREYMIPYFREGNFEMGILKGLTEVETLLLSSDDPDIKSSQETLPNKDTRGVFDSFSIIVIILSLLAPFFAWGIFILIVILIIRNGKKNPNKKDDDYYTTSASKIFWGRGGFGGGGFSGGGFSGGGGHFGGGGFSGRF